MSKPNTAYTPQKFPRAYELDWLRVLAFGILIFYHTGMIFVSWDFHIKNGEISPWMENWMLCVNRWRLPLLFLVSGAGVAFALKKRTNSEFAKERLRRLLIPILFGMFVIVPPQIFFERLQDGAAFNYWEFYKSVFEFVPYPKGSFSWHHLWFVVYILVFSLASIPFFNWGKSESGRKRLSEWYEKLSKGNWIYALLIPLFIIRFCLAPFFPTTHNLYNDWDNLFVSLFYFWLGYVFTIEIRFLDLLMEKRRLSLTLALLMLSAYFYFRFTRLIVDNVPDEFWRIEIYVPIIGSIAIFSLFAVVGYARRYLRVENKWIRLANEAVYPFYILHQTVIIAYGYYVIQWNINLWLKFFIISFLTALTTAMLYQIIIRLGFLRVVFGLKPIAKPMEDSGLEIAGR